MQLVMSVYAFQISTATETECVSNPLVELAVVIVWRVWGVTFSILELQCCGFKTRAYSCFGDVIGHTT